MSTTRTADHEPGLRERKKIETRQRLRAVALRLATERGVEQRISQRLAEIRARRKAGP